MTPTVFVPSVEAQELAKFLRTVPVGGDVTYAELDFLISRDARTHGLQTARRELMREGIVFIAKRGLGLRRANDVDKVAVGAAHVVKVNRAARRGIKVLAAANYDALPPAEQMRHNAHMTVLALAAASTRADALRRIESSVATQKAALSEAKAAVTALRITNVV